MRLLQDIASALAFALTFVTACNGGGSDVEAGPVASATSRYIHSDLAFDEAQQVTPFELVMPSAIPSEFEFEGVSIKEPSGEVPGAGDDLTAIFFLQFWG